MLLIPFILYLIKATFKLKALLFLFLKGVMGNNGPRVSMQQDGWGAQGHGPVRNTASPVTNAPTGQHSLPQGAIHSRMVPNSGAGMPMRPNNQPGPRPMLQSQMMTNGKKT